MESATSNRTAWQLVAILLAAFFSNGCLKKATLPKHLDNAGTDQNLLGTVVSGSMEPSILGPGLAATCRQCSRRFRLSSTSIDEARPVYCPICGGQADFSGGIQPESPVACRKIISSQVVDRESIVVFENENRKEIKRVVGLPGESMKIREGDLWIENRRIQKSLTDFMHQAVLVHAEQSLNVNSRWRADDQGWSVYEHQSVWPSRGSPIALHAEPICDESFFNQGESKTLMPVKDVGLVLVFDRLAEFVRFEQAIIWKDVVLRVDADQVNGALQITFLNETGQPSHSLAINDRDDWIALAIVDDALWMGTQSQQVCLCSQLSTSALQDMGDIRPILSRQSPIAFRSITKAPSVRLVVRDIYRRGVGGRLVQMLPSAAANYTVLGDNDACSDDSRTILEHGIPRSSIVGYLPESDDLLFSLKRQVHDMGIAWPEP